MREGEGRRWLEVEGGVREVRVPEYGAAAQRSQSGAEMIYLPAPAAIGLDGLPLGLLGS